MCIRLVQTLGGPTDTQEIPEKSYFLGRDRAVRAKVNNKSDAVFALLNVYVKGDYVNELKAMAN